MTRIDYSEEYEQMKKAGASASELRQFCQKDLQDFELEVEWDRSRTKYRIWDLTKPEMREKLKAEMLKDEEANNGQPTKQHSD